MTVSPTYVPDLVNATLDLLIDKERGVWHLANAGAVTWAEFAQMVAEREGFRPERIDASPSESLGLIARRPAYSALSSERGILLPSLEEGIESYFRDNEQAVSRRSEQEIKNA